MNNIWYIFIVRRLGKQSNPILSRSDSISNLELNVKIHGPCGPNAHAGADLQAFLIFCFKPNLLSAYGDNRRMPSNSSVDIWRSAPRWVPAAGVLPSGSPRGIPRRVVMSRDSPGSECDGARNTRI